MSIKDQLEAMYNNALIYPHVFGVSAYHCGYIKAIKEVLHQMELEK